jgi:D-alanine-D-alanine ligase
MAVGSAACLYNVRMSHVIVLAGGTSDEREVSLRSGGAVVKALRAAGHQVDEIDPADTLPGRLSDLQAADVVFPALHGAGGEDGTLQKYLEENNIRFVGSGSKASALCFDKIAYDAFLEDTDLSLPETALVDWATYQGSFLAISPHVLKPNDGGSSIDTFIIREPQQRDLNALQQAFDRHGKLILQELIPGAEITVAVVGDKALPTIEIIPPADQEFDYENKYNGATQELCPAQHISQAIQDEAERLASHIHTLTGCLDMSRTDFIIGPNDTLYVLETNTIPGLTDQSLLPKAAAVAGYAMPGLCDMLVQAALARK